jgi:hypothetical protein
MTVTLSQMAEELADSITASVSAPGTYNVSPQGSYSLGGNANTTITSGGYTFANTAITNNGTLGPFTTTGVNTSPFTFSAGTNTQPWYSTTVSPKIKLDGEGADIEVNGWSLIKTLQEIQSRLNLLQPNTALEAEWEELFELGKKYRALEQQIKEKQATWDRLKAMPPPEID